MLKKPYFNEEGMLREYYECRETEFIRKQVMRLLYFYGIVI